MIFKQLETQEAHLVCLNVLNDEARLHGIEFRETNDFLAIFHFDYS